VGAALAAALRSRIAPPIALALAADAGLGVLGEHTNPRYRAVGLALGRWLPAAGWLAFAALLLHTPLAYPHSLRAPTSALSDT
jgi:hypothetical protein